MPVSDSLKHIKAIYTNVRSAVGVIDSDLNMVWCNSYSKKRYPLLFKNNFFKQAFDADDVVRVRNKIINFTPFACFPKNNPYIGLGVYFFPATEPDSDLNCSIVFVCNNSGADAIPISGVIDGEKLTPICEKLIPKIHSCVSSIFISLSLLKNTQTELDPDADNCIDNITQETYKMLRMSSHMQTINLLMTDGDIYMREVNILNFARELLEAAKIYLSKYEIVIDYKKGSQDPPKTAVFDPQLLSQALMALLSNACIAGGIKSPVYIAVTINEDEIEFLFNNAGEPIPEKILSFIELPFYSYSPDPVITEKSDVMKIAGTGKLNSAGMSNSVGLGLTAASNIIKIHNGSLVIQSSVERGTTAVVKIPIIKGKHGPAYVEQNISDYLRNTYSPVYVELYGL